MSINHSTQIPHLAINTTGALQLLEKKILAQENAIESWFQMEWKRARAPVYGSVDLRNAGFKLAPVDMNLFPAGFNNLNPDFLSVSSKAAKKAIQQFVPTAKNILIVPENHTRNLFYWENIHALLTTLSHAGFLVRIGSLSSDFRGGQPIVLKTGAKLNVDMLVNNAGTLSLPGFVPDVILLNNDLSDGIPPELQKVKQPILPLPELGWNQRLKSTHFQYYNEVSLEFAELIEVDPWLINPLFQHCGKVDFLKREGEECVTEHVADLLAAIEKKYKEYKIPYPPYVVIKADKGTYGMAVMMVKSAEEVKLLNRKQRTSMSKSKGGQPVNEVIVQEGVYTFETYGEDNLVSEPVVYLWGENVVGGFYRVHKERGVDENLNSPGMQFEPLAFAEPCDTPKTHVFQPGCQNLFYLYGVIARLSMVSASREMAQFPIREPAI